MKEVLIMPQRKQQKKPRQQNPRPKKQVKKVDKRSITRDQFHKLVKKAAQPTKKRKSS